LEREKKKRGGGRKRERRRMSSSSSSAAPGAKCEDIKKKYDKCFKEWYTDKFLQGDRTPGCLDEWEDYKECMYTSLKDKKLLHLLNGTAQKQEEQGSSSPAK